MRIRRIQLYRFRGFDDLQLLLPKDKNLAVFIGENGSGKTSLLEGISMILQDTLYKQHQYDKVQWNNPLNVQNPHQYGSIAIGLQGPKRSYDFSQSLSANRTRFVSEDRLVLDKNRDLTEDERMEHYKAQAKMAYDEKLYDKALEEYLKLVTIQENVLGLDSLDLAYTYQQIGGVYSSVGNYNNSLTYVEKSLVIREKLLAPNDLRISSLHLLKGGALILLENNNLAIESLEKSLNIQISSEKSHTGHFAWTLTSLGIAYYELEQKDKAIEYLKKGVDVFEKISKEEINTYHKNIIYVYDSLRAIFNQLEDAKNANYYKEKGDKLKAIAGVTTSETPDLLFNIDADSFQHFNEYLEVWTPLVLHYSAQQTSLENYKTALPMAFHIPMTTDFDLISDWFIEYENEENRKRLRVETGYRSVELETIREVMTKGLNLLDGEGNHFTELQTEIDETVKDGQVSSWLSIKKNGKRLNVKQLSDGEKRVLILLIDITRRLITVAKINKVTEFLEGTGVILIDEIEQHLHPKWQRRLLLTLTKLFPNLQFIITTHSPQVLSYVPNGCAFSLENGKAYPQNTYGRDNEWILEAIMDDVNRPVEVKAKLDDYFEAIRHDKMEIATHLRGELETLIGVDEPELIKADILIRRKQKSLVSNETNS